MPVIHFDVRTRLAPEAVLAALTDFSPGRADIWPNIDAAHFELHAQGPGWAEVTEGSSVAGGVWERSRYEWDASSLAVTTLSSNTWARGSRWDYQLTPAAGGGTDIDVKVVRIGRGLKGRALAAVIALIGTRRLQSDMEKVLDRMDTSRKDPPV